MVSRRSLLAPALLTPALLVPGALATWHGATAAPARSRRPLKDKSPLVFLDPGHGGKDPGAIGVSGTYEKHVAFAAAQELRRQLLATGRYRVVISRAADVFIPLEHRVALAQAHGAALFVSMHADALYDHGVRGASVYTLAAHASDAQSATIARHENAADRFGGPQFHGTSPAVASILASLVRQETRGGSARMARGVVAELHRSVPLLQNPDRQAGFVVLKAPDIPSVLVEMGFMSNPEDEAALRQAGHRALVASALRRAIDDFFNPASFRVAG